MLTHPIHIYFYSFHSFGLIPIAACQKFWYEVPRIGTFDVTITAENEVSSFTQTYTQYVLNPIEGQC